jgi:hypothetical protein
MSKLAGDLQSSPESERKTEPKGPNLLLLYALLALGLLAATGFAAMVIWPFYGRR